MKKLIRFLTMLAVVCTLIPTLTVEVNADVVWAYQRGGCDYRAEEEMALVDLGYITDKDLYDECCSNWYSVGVIQDMLNRGYMSGYVQQLKDGGWIPNDFTPTTASSNQSSASTPSTPAPEPAPTVTYTQEEIDAAWKESKRVEPTCTENGYIQYKNSITGEKKKETLAMLEHTYEKTEETPATCTEVGNITYTCKGCGDAYTNELPIVEHNYIEYERIEPTCEEDGVAYFTCTACQLKREDVLAATSHDSGEWVIATDARWFTEGLKELRCTKDAAVLATETIPQTCPVSLGVVLIIIVSVAGLVLGVALFVKKKKLK